MPFSDSPEADAALRALIEPHREALDQCQFRLAPLLSSRASPTMVRESLEAFALDVLRKDRLQRGTGVVPATAGKKSLPPTPINSPRPAIEQNPASDWPEIPRHPHRPRRANR
jgi:hypothetical protein